jgi:1-deoxy-D-xylulose-5-phosphate reductoisomerase
MPAVLNAANEVAVEAFLAGRLEFLKVPRLIQKTMQNHQPLRLNSVEDVLQAHSWAREEAQKTLNRGIL